MFVIASPAKAVSLLQKRWIRLWWVGRNLRSRGQRTNVCLPGRIRYRGEFFVKLAWEVSRINPTILTRRAIKRRHITGQLAKFSRRDEQRRLFPPDWAEAELCWWVYTSRGANHLRRHASRTYVVATYHLIPHHHTISCLTQYYTSPTFKGVSSLTHW